ncbi:cmgc cdk protein kinase [Cystoisospora suis]|uniref:Cmgc cdk protein kinase n=1 Tax=Cystoisospora suis TaxID=483139 RepID=A0A2C6L7V4_9APIC|nr:cmgc cdk protein kinase [Cystoisospora suis]
MRDTCNSLCIMPVLFLSALQRRLPLSTEAASFVCLLFSLFHALFSPSHGDFSLLFTAPARTTEKSTLAGVLPSDDEHALLLNSSFVSSHLYLPEEKLLQPGLPQVSGESGATENYSHTKGRGGENVSSSVDSRRAGAKDDLHGKETGRSSGLSSLSTQKESLSQQPLSASSLREDVENTFLNKQVSLVSPRALPAPQSSLSAATPSDLSISLRGNTQPQDLSLAQRGDIIDWRYLLFRRLHSFPSSPSLSSALVPFYDEAETGLYPGDVAAAYISSVAEERRKKVPREINTWRDMGVVEGENVDSSPQIVSPVIMEETQETRLPSFCSDTPGGHTPGQVRKDCFALHQRGEGKVSGGDECMFQEEGNRVLCITREDNTTSVDEPQLKPSQLQLKDIFVVPPGVHTAGDTEQKAVSFSKKHFQLSPEPSLALLSPAKREQQKRALLRILTRETQRGVSSRKFLTLTEGISGSVPRGSLAGTGRQDDFSSDEDIQWLWVVALEGPAIFRFLGWADEDQGEDDKAVATEASGLQDGVCANPDVFLKAFPFWTSAEGEQKQYELFSKLGKGSYGEVWAALALDTQAEHRYVVLKRMLHPKDDRGKRIRLSGEREIFFGQMLAGTPQIARFLEAFTLPTDGGSGVRTRDGVGDARGGKHGKGSKTSRGSDETCAGMCHQDKQGSEQRRRRGWFFSKKARVNFKQERMRKEKDKEKEDLWLVFVNEGYSLSHLFFSPDEQRGGLLTPSDLWWLLKRGKDSKKNSPDEGTNKDDGVNTGPTAAERMSTSSSSSSSFGGSKRKKPSPFQAFYDTFAQGAAAPDFLILLRALMRQLLVALAKAHSFHITHRDVKPVRRCKDSQKGATLYAPG